MGCSQSTPTVSKTQDQPFEIHDRADDNFDAYLQKTQDEVDVRNAKEEGLEEGSEEGSLHDA